MIRSGSGWSSRKRPSRLVRWGTTLLGLSAAVPGVWALAAPRSFFRDFPGAGLGWVASFPPYNEHLIRDVGSFYLGFAVLLLLAALSADRVALRVALLGFIAFTIPHFIFHLQHRDSGGLGSPITLGAGGVLALVLLVGSQRSQHH